MTFLLPYYCAYYLSGNSRNVCYIDFTFIHCGWLYVLCLVAQSCPTLCNPTDCSPLGFSAHGDSPGKNTGVGCHALLQRQYNCSQLLNPTFPVRELYIFIYCQVNFPWLPEEDCISPSCSYLTRWLFLVNEIWTEVLSASASSLILCSLSQIGEAPLFGALEWQQRVGGDPWQTWVRNTLCWHKPLRFSGSLLLHHNIAKVVQCT